MKRRNLYTTSEYLDALELPCDGNIYSCRGKDFGLFSNPGAAEADAKWMADYYRREKVKKRKPTVYRIRLERVKP